MLAFIFLLGIILGSAFRTKLKWLEHVLAHGHLPAGIAKPCHLDVLPHDETNKREN